MERLYILFYIIELEMCLRYEFSRRFISCPVASFVYNRGGRKIIARSDIATQRYRDRYSSST
ncbi:MAG: hypothetical protein F6K25_11810 [Okeania sp. SIO2G4]|uniref:hypothetical protein n=1 Tax=unclassified Okeania TaxID=2634635 RepID=UPI0013BA764F|nr:MULTISPECIES: hypothetical protein [unclassified Okeania]NEP45202.1 hypothetical protein [Okeania sp. SIO2H7]NEP72713.1 hypothetical protein [Okeania sp. SIO2G5]NEP93347.1 hypothetical protein [Okeania sp. SIO2F5]NEQ91359.1 hypothetical protein [Okeania sp. SIO2G4]